MLADLRLRGRYQVIDERHYGARIDGACYKIRSSDFHAIVEPWPLGINGLRHHASAAGMVSQWLAFAAWVPADGLREFVATPVACGDCSETRLTPCPYCAAAHARGADCSWCDEDGQVDCRACTHRPALFLGRVFNRALVNDVLWHLGGVDTVGLFDEKDEGRGGYCELLLKCKNGPTLGVVMSMRPDLAEPDGVWP